MLPNVAPAKVTQSSRQRSVLAHPRNIATRINRQSHSHSNGFFAISAPDVNLRTACQPLDGTPIFNHKMNITE